MLEHGGRLIEASKKYKRPLSNWLDLSTGINPNGWPVADIPANCWSRLPEEEDGLIDAARSYYGGQHVLAVAGSQAAIQALPIRRHKASRIAVLSPAYHEHAHAWKKAGFDVTSFEARQIDEAVSHNDVVILVNPCNPTGARFKKQDCLNWHKKLSRRGGWLVVDEAFMDTTPENSLVEQTGIDGLVVLRSLGKFFGLAGARVGFVFAPPPLLTALVEDLGPWTLTGPSRSIAKQALEDVDWQRTARQNLDQQGRRLADLLARHDLEPGGATALFTFVQTPLAAEIHKHLARQGILTRLFGTPSSLRFGLPGNEAQWTRLEQALRELVPLCPAGIGARS